MMNSLYQKTMSQKTMSQKTMSQQTMLQKISAAVLTIFMAVVLATSHAVFAAEKTPQAIVEQTTKDLFAVVKSNNAAAKKTDAYYADVTKILDAIVDFPFIARAVMGKTGKVATPAQVEKFAVAFKNGLVKTYGKGIANYADSTFKVLPSTAEAGARRLSVELDVKEKDNVHRLAFTMALNKTNEWKLINVVLNGVNLGDSFRSQFDQAMIKHAGNVDKVIDNWLSNS
jgi:phospholipid transport system substrate-binding protein